MAGKHGATKRTFRHELSDWLVCQAVRAALCFVQILRIETCDSLARGLAVVCYDWLRLRRSTVDENLQFAFPEATPAQRQQLGREMWHHLVLMACELAHVPRKIHDTNWRDHILMAWEDKQTFVRYLLDERPIVIVSGHYGNFEVGGIVTGLLGFPTYTVARPLDNPYLHRLITEHRERKGQFMLPKQGSAPMIDAILNAGGTLVLLGDQAAGPKGCWVDFFGRPASCHKAVALFSLVSHAPMLLAYSCRGRRPMQFELGVAGIFDPATDESSGVQALTQWYSDRLEQTIRQRPGQYWWLHRRWKIKPPRRRSRSAVPKSHLPAEAAQSTKTSDLKTTDE